MRGGRRPLRASGWARTTALTDAHALGLVDRLRRAVRRGAGRRRLRHRRHRPHLPPRALPRRSCGRPILTAFLGYVAVVLGLLVDLGRPWNIWRMIDLLAARLAAVRGRLVRDALPHGAGARVRAGGLRRAALERALARHAAGHAAAGDRRHRAVHAAPVVARARCSCSPRTACTRCGTRRILPLLFFVSAVGLGLVMVATESVVTAWLYRREAEWPLLRGLTRAAVDRARGSTWRCGSATWRWRGQLHHVGRGLVGRRSCSSSSCL